MLAAAFLIATPPSYYYGSGVQGMQIATICQDTSDNVTANACTGYILGVYDALAASHQICGNQAVTMQQIVAVGKKAFADHPELWSRTPEFVLRQTFKTAFPCR